MVRCGYSGALPHSLRRQREAGQHRRTDARGRCRRGAGGRREPRGQKLRRDRDKGPAGCRIIGVSESNQMLYYLLSTIYVLSCLILLLVILLQQGKGGDMASAFGGGSSQAAFGARAGATLLSRLTTGFAVMFMLAALGLAIMGQTAGSSSVLSGSAPPTAPAVPAGTPAAGQPPATAPAAPAATPGTPGAAPAAPAT